MQESQSAPSGETFFLQAERSRALSLGARFGSARAPPAAAGAEARAFALPSAGPGSQRDPTRVPGVAGSQAEAGAKRPRKTRRREGETSPCLRTRLRFGAELL